MHEKATALLSQHLPDILQNDGVAVPDDEEEMNWRLFFAHSQDMQGFRADIFTGGPNEDRHPWDPTFVGLREAWGRESRSLISDLAAVWDDTEAREKLTTYSNRQRSPELRAEGVRSTMDLLQEWGTPGVRTFARVLEQLSGHKIARKTNGMIRAYVQNSRTLRGYGCSFRAYLQEQVTGDLFPPADIVAAEKQWLHALQRDFYNVGEALANYLICDWLLWLWREGRIEWFGSYKRDSVHLQAVENGRLDEGAAEDFAAFCRSLRIPAGMGALSGRPCPPRLLNECIWLEWNRSAGPSVKAEQAPGMPAKGDRPPDRTRASHVGRRCNPAMV